MESYKTLCCTLFAFRASRSDKGNEKRRSLCLSWAILDRGRTAHGSVCRVTERDGQPAHRG
jgi:hypothetical protein